MPELPEVETICLTLKPKLIGRTIISGEVLLPKMLQNIIVEEFLQQISSKKVVDLSRRGKYLKIHLSEKLIIAFHLRMTGQLIVESAEKEAGKATYLKIRLDDGNELRFLDQRKFGRVFLFPETDYPVNLKKLGPEPLGSEFSMATFKKQIANKKIAIKKVLLDQEIIAGIGNIYADESLFLAGIHPARLVDSLTEDELEKLYHAIRKVLNEGIQYRGTTKRDYRDGDGKAGSYQEQLRVYGRKGLQCPQCQNMIVKMNFAGRGTHFCPICQK